MTSVPSGAARDPGGDAAARARRDRRIVIIALAALIPFLLLVVGAIAGVVFYFVKSSDAYKLAEATIRESAEIRQVVGEGLEFGWFPMGSVETTGGGGGHAELSIRVKGSAGSTTVYVTLGREAGRWRVTSASYEGRDGAVKRLGLKRQARA